MVDASVIFGIATFAVPAAAGAISAGLITLVEKVEKLLPGDKE